MQIVRDSVILIECVCRILLTIIIIFLTHDQIYSHLYDTKKKMKKKESLYLQNPEVNCQVQEKRILCGL